MRKIFIVVLFSCAVFISPGFAGAVYITGKVIDTFNRPVEGAITQLSNIGLTDTTNTNGEFYLSDQTGIRKNDRLKNNLVNCKGNVVSLSCISGTIIKIEVSNILGRTVFQMQQSVSANGIIEFTIPFESYANNLYVVRIQVNGHAQQFKIVSNQSNSLLLLAGWENGPGTHSGDSNEALVTADGFLEVR